MVAGNMVQSYDWNEWRVFTVCTACLSKDSSTVKKYLNVLNLNLKIYNSDYST